MIISLEVQRNDLVYLISVPLAFKMEFEAKVNWRY